MRYTTSSRPVALVVAGLAVCLGCTEPEPRVVISEIMYHPVQEPTPDEEHQFLEIANAGDTEVDLTGWGFRGVTFTFAPGTRLGPGKHLAVAKNRKSLRAVAAYRLDAADVVGDFRGQLSNGGETISLLDAAGRVVDEVSYLDRAPWPAAADALGGGESWLAPENLPLEAHRFMGRSLERISLLEPGNDPANWDASPLDGATPGRRNASRGEPRPVAIRVRAAVRGRQDVFIGEMDQPVIQVRFSKLGKRGSPRIEYFVDDIEAEGEPRKKVELAPMGDEETTRDWQATLPRQAPNKIVRYRVLADRGDGEEVVSPRPSDPYGWHAYFVAPDAPGRTRSLFLFIKKADWETLWDWASRGRVPGNTGGGRPDMCEVNPNWFTRLPAVLVADGHVYDVQARYQGSRTNRTNGAAIDPALWPADVPLPARPSSFRALSWHINFPRWDRFQGRERSFNLNKLTQACQGFTTTVGFSLFEQAGIPAPRTEYVRFFINGAYYHYMQRHEAHNEDLLRRYWGEDLDVGDLFKAIGARWDEGPYGFTDERPLQPYCGYSASERFAYSYKRQTLDDVRTGSDDVMKLVEDLHAARAAGAAAERKFFEANFDLALLLNYMAVINWMGPFDDFWQNHYLYRRPDGRWMMMPQDMDLLMGGYVPADGSFFVGAINVRNNRSDYFSFLKDSFLRVYRAEFIDKLKELSRTVLSPENVFATIDAAVAGYVLDEAAASPAGMSCGGDPDALAGRMRRFTIDRHLRLLEGLFD